jgi:hypothetical protein
MLSMNNYKIDRAKWAKMTIFQQMANIGAEVGRTFSAIRRNDEAMSEAAMARAVDLFEATAESNSFVRNKEILRAKEQFLTAYDTKKPDDGLERYFTQFAFVR